MTDSITYLTMTVFTFECIHSFLYPIMTHKSQKRALPSASAIIFFKCYWPTPTSFAQSKRRKLYQNDRKPTMLHMYRTF